jgi:hypothetical protein
MAEGRSVSFTFYIPFYGGPARVCEETIREHVTHSLLNSLSEIHPDIRCEVTGAVREGDTLRRWERRWEGTERQWVDRWADGAVREES